jgi:threonine/homoserine/homoserine lactone efflux protein
MNQVIGEILPLAVGIAISPIPIIAAILMLLSPRAKGTSIGFMIGWLAGIVVAIVLSSLLSSVIPPETGGRSPVAGVIKIILGVLLLVLAIKQWRTRPAKGDQASLPKWMSAIDSMSAVKALWLGFLLAAANPKNLLLAIAAGVVVGGAGLTVGQMAVVIMIFVLLAASTVLVPVFGYLIASARLAEPLDKLRQWLVDNNAVIMAVLLLVLGVALIGKGFADF